jgi:predicted AAA+ superfamily ATPase
MPETKKETRYSPANAFDLPGFVETRQVQQVADLCQALRQTRTLGALVGLPGVGKTWALQHIAQQEPEPSEILNSPVLYTAADVKGNARALLVNLLNCLGPDYRAPITDMTRLACCWIHRRMVELIIIDEAARLDRDLWEIVRDIHDRTRCSFLLVGQPDLPRRLQRREALYNRLSLTIELVPLTFDELFEFVLQWQKKRPRRDHRSSRAAEFYVFSHDDSEDTAIIKELYRVTLGNLRRVQQFIDQSERVATLNGDGYVHLGTARAVAALLSGHHT